MTPMTQIRRTRATTLAWLLFLVVTAAYAFWFRDSFAYLFNMWSTEDLYSQGWLIAGVSLFLMLTPVIRKQLEPGPPTLRYLPVLFILSGIWGVGYLTQTSLLQLIVLPPMFWLCSVCCLGSRVASRWRFPVAYFFLALPFWGMLQPILLSMTVDVTVFVVRVWGIPLHLSGNVVTIPAGRFEIVSGCSGAHQFVVSVAYTVLAAHLTQHSLMRQGVLVVSGVVLALIANWVRVVTLVLVGEYTNMQHYLIQDDHVTFGWGLFVVLVVIPVLVISRWLNWSEATGAAAGEVHQSTAADAPLRLAIAAAALSLLALSPGPSLLRIAGAAGDGQVVSASLPPAGNGWSEPAAVRSGWRPWFVGADQTIAGQYRRDDLTVVVFVVSYHDETQGRELINQSNAIADPRTWKTMSSNRGQLEHDVETLAWNEVLIRSVSGQSRLVRYWYDIAGRRTTAATSAKLLQALARLRGYPQSSLIAVSVECDGVCDSAQAALDDFLATGAQGFLEITAVEMTE